jgi:hypothetical protein
MGLAASEVITISAITYSFYYSFSTLELAVYHRFFWALYPMVILFRLGIKKLQKYIWLTIGMTAIVFLSAELDWVKKHFISIYLMTGYFHIIISMPLSHANPNILLNLFRRPQESGLYESKSEENLRNSA